MGLKTSHWAEFTVAENMGREEGLKPDAAVCFPFFLRSCNFVESFSPEGILSVLSEYCWRGLRFSFFLLSDAASMHNRFRRFRENVVSMRRQVLEQLLRDLPALKNEDSVCPDGFTN